MSNSSIKLLIIKFEPKTDLISFKLIFFSRQMHFLIPKRHTKQCRFLKAKTGDTSYCINFIILCYFFCTINIVKRRTRRQDNDEKKAYILLRSCALCMSLCQLVISACVYVEIRIKIDAATIVWA